MNINIWKITCSPLALSHVFNFGIVLEGKFFKFAVEEMKGYVQNSRQSVPLIPWEAVPPSSRQTVPPVDNF